eukprot:g12353.t1
MSRRQPQRHETAIAVGSADEIGRIVIKSGQRFVKRHPAVSVAWVLGLLVSILASGYTPSPAAVQNYEIKMANLNNEVLAEAEGEMLYWDQVYRRSKGMFWTCDATCKANRQQYEERRRVFSDLNKDYLKGVAEAKSELGIFSEDGVEETRDLFWRKVSGGKQYAKRATMWDAVFVGIGTMSRRDEGLASIIARIAFKFVVNLTIGLFMAVIQFLFSVWTVIWSYQPDPISTVAFATMASLAAVSLLATWLLGLAAVGVTGVYAVAKLAETAQIEAARQAGGSDPRLRQQFVQQQAYQQQRQQQQQYQPQQQQQPYQQRPQQPRRRQAATPAAPMSTNWNNID